MITQNLLLIHPRPRRARSRAFSLVEVTIALAIASMGFVTLLGLLPQGLDMARQSSEMSVGSKIIQKIAGEMQSGSWTKINWNGYGGRRYFNDEGVEITASQARSGTNAAGPLTYVAAVYVPPQGLDLFLPSGTSASQGAEPFVRRVTISVTTSTNPDFDFDHASPGRLTSLPVLIAKMGD